MSSGRSSTASSRSKTPAPPSTTWRRGSISGRSWCGWSERFAALLHLDRPRLAQQADLRVGHLLAEGGHVLGVELVEVGQDLLDGGLRLLRVALRRGARRLPGGAEGAAGVLDEHEGGVVVVD